MDCLQQVVGKICGGSAVKNADDDEQNEDVLEPLPHRVFIGAYTLLHSPQKDSQNNANGT